jgi:hypothetical protein
MSKRLKCSPSRQRARWGRNHSQKRRLARTVDRSDQEQAARDDPVVALEHFSATQESRTYFIPHRRLRDEFHGDVKCAESAAQFFGGSL